MVQKKLIFRTAKPSRFKFRGRTRLGFKGRKVVEVTQFYRKRRSKK